MCLFAVPSETEAKCCWGETTVPFAVPNRDTTNAAEGSRKIEGLILSTVLSNHKFRQAGAVQLYNFQYRGRPVAAVVKHGNPCRPGQETVEAPTGICYSPRSTPPRRRSRGRPSARNTR